MLVLRVLGLLVAVALGGCVLMYVITSERKYLLYAWQTFRYALFLFVVILFLFLGERLLVAI